MNIFCSLRFLNYGYSDERAVRLKWGFYVENFRRDNLDYNKGLTLLPRILMLSFHIISQNKIDEFGMKAERREKQKLRCHRLLFRTVPRPCLKAISLKIVNKKRPGWILLFCRVSIRRQTTQKLSDNDLAGEPVVYKNIMKEKIALLLSRSKREKGRPGALHQVVCHGPFCSLRIAAY